MVEAHALVAFKIVAFAQMVLLVPLASLVLTLMELHAYTVQALQQDF